MKAMKLLAAALMVQMLVPFLGPKMAQAEDKVYRWRAVTHQIVGTSRYTETVAPFCEMVKKMSKGRLIIEPYGAGVLFPVSETFDAVRDGMIQMSMTWAGFWGSKHPLFTIVANRPGGPLTTFEENFYRNEQLFPIVEKLYKKFGVTYLGAFDFNPSEILVSTKPIRKFEDFAGLNIRTGGLGGTFYSKLGSSVVLLSPPEIYQALQLGTVDGAEYNDFIVNKEMAFHEVTKYVIEPALHTDATDDKDLIVNSEAWESLPEDLQAIVLAARDMARYKSAISYGAKNEIARQEWVKAGVEIITLPEEDVKRIRAVGMEILNEMSATDPIIKEYVDAYAKVLFELGYEQDASTLGFKK